MNCVDKVLERMVGQKVKDDDGKKELETCVRGYEKTVEMKIKKEIERISHI